MVAGLTKGEPNSENYYQYAICCRTQSSETSNDDTASYLHQRRPDWTGGDGVASDTFFSNNLIAEGAHECNNGTFCRRVVQELRVPDRHVDRRVEDDSRACRHIRDSCLREKERVLYVSIRWYNRLVAQKEYITLQT